MSGGSFYSVILTLEIDNKEVRMEPEVIVLHHSDSKESAQALFRYLAREFGTKEEVRKVTSEPKAAPETCPTCGSNDSSAPREIAEAAVVSQFTGTGECSDPFHKAGTATEYCPTCSSPNPAHDTFTHPMAGIVTCRDKFHGKAAKQTERKSHE